MSNNAGSKIEQRFIGAFNVVKESNFRDLDGRVTGRLAKLAVCGETSFEVIVQYANLKSESYCTLDSCFVQSTNSTAPKSVNLTWRSISSNEKKSECQIEFVTEQPGSIENTTAIVGQPAEIKLSVQSNNEDWARGTFSAMEQVIDTVKTGKLYTPFLFFQNKMLVTFCSFLIFTISLVTVMNFVTPLVDGPRKQEKISAIKSAQPIDKKIDVLAEMFFANRPFNLASLVPGILGIVFGFVFFVVSLLLLPKISSS